MFRNALGADEIFHRSSEAKKILNTHFTYLFVDLGCLLVPFLFSFHPRIQFYRELRYCALPALFTASTFIAWDAVFTAKGVWSFNPDYLLGIYFWNLPLEEILFFICIPYACVFTYFCIGKIFTPLAGKVPVVISFILGAALIVGALLHTDKLYTFTTFLFCGIALIASGIFMRKYIGVFLISYCLVIPFFLLSNGILTGTFLDAPVVSYNNAENLGLRIFTIPFEDVFYGMLLVLMNVAGYELMRAVRLRSVSSST